MDYKALYRKYRPKTFDDVKGQDHIVTTLKNIIESNKISHSYIFNGPRGVGKTSVAKIFANVLNCQHSPNKTKACLSCLDSIDRDVDVIEMDAASNNGVDDIRTLKDKIEINPVSKKYKVYIIDEVHMLSKGAFNALLKTLEEPPKHAIFILATTDSHKIPSTIISRSQRFNFRRINESALSSQLKKVLSNEGLKIEENALKLIISLSEGGMRDALSITEQCAAYGLGIIKYEDVLNIFGAVSNVNIIKFITALSANDLSKAINIFSSLKEMGINPHAFVKNTINVARDWLVFRKTRNLSFLEFVNGDEIKNLRWNEKFILELVNYLQEVLEKVSHSQIPFQIVEFAIIQISMIHKKLQQENNIIVESIHSDNTENTHSTHECLSEKDIENIVQKYLGKARYEEDDFQYKNMENHINKNDGTFNKGLSFEISKESKKTTNDEENNLFSYYNEDQEYTNAEKMTKIFDDSFVNSKIEKPKTQKIDYQFELDNNNDLDEKEHTDIFKNELENDKSFEQKQTNIQKVQESDESTIVSNINDKIKSKNHFQHVVSIDMTNPGEQKSKHTREEEILNCLFHYSDDEKNKLVNKYNLLKMVDENGEGSFYEHFQLFDNFQTISFGNNFWLVYSKNTNLVKKLDSKRNTAWFYKFSQKLLRKNVHLFVIDDYELRSALATVKQMKDKVIPRTPKWDFDEPVFDDVDSAHSKAEKIFGLTAKIKINKNN
ncbi:DNA polymerase III subunit gamma/tau [Mycoplasmopsis ciconiae]|uniref:DNA polymerase III subunit gamma/tau n=1 Tax=Mycoplasmopsis ciconiae TaxID=561067 RepID=A0ABU7MLZ9_9BACT|nr:DNA polymerase III subunit gamma/tau [Mycoplasmopsis ciconiae]